MIYTFDSTQSGAPVLSGTAGALAALLKACLVDGFGAGSVSSLVVASGMAKLAYAGAHPFKVGSVVRIAGATTAGLNGDKVVTETTGNTASFPAPGVADGPASGTITSRAAPAGWQELFPGLSNVLLLKPTAVEASGCVLRLDDTSATAARVVGFETATSNTTGVGAFPTEAQYAGGMYWPKSDATGGAARAWRLVADAQALHLWLAPQAANQQHGVLFSFGDLVADKSGDAYACLLTGGGAGATTTTSAVPGCLGYAHATSASADCYVPRATTGLGSAQLAKKVAAYNTAAGYAGTTAYNGNALPYPNPADNSLRLAPVDVLVGTSGMRGRIAGVHHSPQILGDAFSTGDMVVGTGVYADRRMLVLRVGAPGAALGNAGAAFIDITGPWRL